MSDPNTAFFWQWTYQQGSFIKLHGLFCQSQQSRRMLHHGVLNINSGGFCKCGYSGKLCHVVTSLPTPAHLRNTNYQLCLITRNSLHMKKFFTSKCWLKEKNIISNHILADYETILWSLELLLWHWIFCQFGNFCHFNYVWCSFTANTEITLSTLLNLNLWYTIVFRQAHSLKRWMTTLTLIW